MAKDKKENNLNTVASKKYLPSLKITYEEEIVQKLKSTFNYSNLMEVPKLVSISINIGLGDAKNNSKGFLILNPTLGSRISGISTILSSIPPTNSLDI